MYFVVDVVAGLNTDYTIIYDVITTYNHTQINLALQLS